jgi:hypothetical protein
VRAESGESALDALRELKRRGGRMAQAADTARTVFMTVDDDPGV